jgi:tetraacyldisaccharide 4'-kinase
MAWAERWRHRGPLWLLCLKPLSWVYGLGWRLRRRGTPQDLGVPVLSVGNLSVGGTGKSPVVRLLAARARAAGLKPAILLRGYGAADGPRPLAVSLGQGSQAGVRASGDEAQEHASMPGVQVWIGKDRVAAGRAALAQGAACLVLDDGFQRRGQLARGLDLLLADWNDLQLGEHLLPAGPWREPWSQAAQAGALLLSNAPPDLGPAKLGQSLPAAWAGLPLFRLQRLPAGLREWPSGRRLPLSQLRRRTVLALSGLGRPQSFEDSLVALEARPIPWRFKDHHRFSLQALGRPPQDAELVVTTAKDATRLPLGWIPRRPVWILELRARVTPEQPFWALVDRALAAGSRKRKRR